MTTKPSNDETPERFVSRMTEDDWNKAYKNYVKIWELKNQSGSPHSFETFKKFDYLRALKCRKIYENDLCKGNVKSLRLTRVIGNDEYLGIFHSSDERFESVFSAIDSDKRFRSTYHLRNPQANS